MFYVNIYDIEERVVEGAEIEVVPWMPEHSGGHGAIETPYYVNNGGGRYTIRNLYLHHKGDWDLIIKIQYSGLKEKAVFEFFDIM